MSRCSSHRDSTKFKESADSRVFETQNTVKQTKLKFVSCTKYHKVSKQHEEITHAVTRFIAMDRLVLTTVEKLKIVFYYTGSVLTALQFLTQL